MKARKSWISVAALSILVALTVQPVSIDAQCVVTATSAQSFPPTISITKFLSVSGTCRQVGSNNVVGCFPSAAPIFTGILVAAAVSGATNPSCSWTCMCGGVPTSIQIDGSDGLPVELMGFSVE